MARPRMDYITASNIIRRAKIDPAKSFFTLNTDQKLALKDAADEFGYRVPPNANSSRISYFHAYLIRVLNKRG